LPKMKANFPSAPVTETEAGHFLQEEGPSEIADAIMRVVTQVQRN
jgi:haloalkane dehalogenase